MTFDGFVDPVGRIDPDRLVDVNAIRRRRAASAAACHRAEDEHAERKLDRELRDIVELHQSFDFFHRLSTV